uniref:DUF1482 family protein n=1 Tax=Serratia marcescens TaxID=615 RepID=A0A9X8VM70_SERMA
MFGLFKVICFAGSLLCDYQPAGYIYPTFSDCAADIREQLPSTDYQCLPVDAVIPAKEHSHG